MSTTDPTPTSRDARASAACRPARRRAQRDRAHLHPQPRLLLRRQQGAEGHQLDIPDRQVTGMIGPSGCGKSTLLRVLNRMYSLYPGQRADGRGDDGRRNIIDPGVDLNALRAKIGMVFQKPTPSR
jgi:ABC-type phosphate transport system ATPase subunit